METFYYFTTRGGRKAKLEYMTPVEREIWSKNILLVTHQILQANTSAEHQVLRNNIDFIFSYFLSNYLKMNLIIERPHDFNLKVKDFPKVFKTLAEFYSDKKF